MKEGTKKSTIALTGFNTSLSGNNSRQDTKVDTDALCTMINKLDLIYMNTAPNNCRICIFFKYYMRHVTYTYVKMKMCGMQLSPV